MLVSLLAKACLTSSLGQYKDLIDLATAFVRGQPNVLLYQGEGKTVRQFIEHTLVFHDAEDTAAAKKAAEANAGQEAEDAKDGQGAADALFKLLWEEDSKGREWLRWNVHNSVISLYERNPPSVHGLSVFDVAAHVNNRSLCNALSTLNALNMWVGNAIGFSSGFKTLVQGLKENDDMKIAGGLAGIGAVIADFAVMKIIRNHALPLLSNLSGMVDASEVASKLVMGARILSIPHFLTHVIARPLLCIAWAVTSFKDIEEDVEKGHKGGAILAVVCSILGLVTILFPSVPIVILAGIGGITAYLIRD